MIIKKTSGKYRAGQNKKLFVFDLETIPDVDVVKNLLHIDTKEMSDSDLTELLQKYHEENYNNSFPRQLFHKIVSFSYVLADLRFNDDGTVVTKIELIKSGGELNSSEQELIEGFFSGIRKMNTHVNLISFNGRGFDIPVLKYRAMKYGINADWLMDCENKWENYSRNVFDYHCDLLDVLSDFGSSAKIKLHEICTLLKIPVKLDGGGSSVLENYQNGKIDEIRNYCETDVIATYLVYLYYLNLCGHGNLKNNIDDVYNYLAKFKDEKPHFQKYLEKWDDYKS